MQYVLYFLLVALIFGLIALIDFLFRRLFPKTQAEKHGKAVRLPRRTFLFGLVMSLLSVIVLLFLDLDGDLLLLAGGVVVLLMGLYLLVNYMRFAIFYDDEGFTYRTLTKAARSYRYADILGQRSFLARSGLNTSLYMTNGDEIQLYSAMDGLSGFLNKAFFAWCRTKSVDPDTVENAPHMLVFFPEPDFGTQS